MSTEFQDVASFSPDAAVVAAADSSPASETSPVVETATEGGVSAGVGEQEAQPVDVFEGIPSIDELTQQSQQKIPYSEGLLRLRTELERIKPEYDGLSKYKTLTELGEPEELQSAYELRSKLFSPVINPETQQPEYDERGLQRRTSQPWLQSMEEETPGFVPRHLNDVLSYVYKDPATGVEDNLLRFHFRSLGLDPDRFDDYLNIDSLVAKNNGGAPTPEELTAIAEPDKEAYRTLPSTLRGVWKDIPEDEQRYHLDAAQERLENKRWREQQEQTQKQTEETNRQQFQARVQNDIYSDLVNVRKEGLTSLRDSLTKAVPLSTDPNVQSAYVDAIIAPLALLLSPDFHDLGSHMLEGMGVKLDGAFNDTLNAFVQARQEYVIAKAHGLEGEARTALKEADGKFARIMAKFNDFALKRATVFGHQAKQIAVDNGQTLAAASAARPMSNGNGASVETAAGLLPAGMDPYSPEASTYLFNAARQRR